MNKMHTIIIVLKATLKIIGFFAWTVYQLLNAALNTPKKYEGHILNIIDGDSIIFETTKKQTVHVRLQHIDTPEYNQPGATLSKNSLQRLCGNDKISLKTRQQKSYDRILGILEHPIHGEINLTMVKIGAAWVNEFHDTPKRYIRAFKKSQRQKRGLWYKNAQNINPTTWRKLHT